MEIIISTEEAHKIALTHYTDIFPENNVMVKIDDYEIYQRKVVDRVKELLSMNEKLKAIKYFRAVTGFELADSHKAVKDIGENIPVSFHIEDESAVGRT